MEKPPDRGSRLVGRSGEVSENGVKTVLILLDDRERLLGVLADYLGASGYVVLESTTIESAFNRFKEVQGEVDLLITDISDRISREAEAVIGLWMYRSTLKLLFVSTRPLASWSVFNTALFTKLPKDSVRILEKPFSVLDLLIRVNELIGRPENAVVQTASMCVAFDRSLALAAGNDRHAG